MFWSWSELAHGRCWSPLPSYQQVLLQVLLAGSGECCLCPRHCWSQPNDFARFILTSVTFSYRLITGLVQTPLSFYSRAPYVTNDIPVVMYDFGSWKAIPLVKHVKQKLRRCFQCQMNPDNAYTGDISYVFWNGLNVLSYRTSKTELFSNNQNRDFKSVSNDSVLQYEKYNSITRQKTGLFFTLGY
jgi:hypothetical protein